MRHSRTAIAPTLLLVGVSISAHDGPRAPFARSKEPAVHARFDLTTPAGSPFPSDRFTTADPQQNTGRRVALPMPSDCIANESDCNDIIVLNELDGFNQHPRVAIPFDGDIDLATVTPSTVFIISVPDHDNGFDAAVAPDGPIVRVIPLGQIVWDPETHTLHARADEALEEHTRYAIVLTRGVLDTRGKPIGASGAFENYRRLLAHAHDPQLQWYRKELRQAERAARFAGVRRRDLAVISTFRTQSATYLARRIHEDIFAAPPPARADFNIGHSGSRAVYPFASVSAITLNRQVTSDGALSATPVDIGALRLVPGAVGQLAFGRYQSPDYRVHPGEYIPAIPTRTGTPARQGTATIYFNLYLPAGPMPTNGWPVAIVGHGSSAHKNFAPGTHTPYLAANGVAMLIINTVGHGFGPLSTLQLTLDDGASVALPAGGRSFDQNGDGQIAINEGFSSTGIHTVRDQADGYMQMAADLMQLVRVVQEGVDVDGDEQPDLDPSRITYWGWSLGSHYGMTFFAATPEMRAAVFSTIGSPTLEHRRLSPIGRPNVGMMLAGRTPSLLNSDYGVTSIDGVPVGPPFFDENVPLRHQAPVVNTVPGAIQIQQLLERYAWAGRNADQAAYARLVRLRLPAGQSPRPVLVQFGRGDQRTQNPNTSELLRVAGLEDRAWLYRHDLFYPTMPSDYQALSMAKDAHAFHAALLQVPWRPIVMGAHHQASQFLASDGTFTPWPSPTQYWEQPVVLPEDLGYIP